MQHTSRVVIILEAVVKESDWAELKKIHAATKFLPPGLISSVLIQNSEQSSEWKMINTWQDWRSYSDANSAPDSPGGLHMLEASNAFKETAKFFTVASELSSADTKRTCPV